jgi:hypothetical protein
MNPTRPEAEIEYSRGRAASEGDSGRAGGSVRGPSGRHRSWVAGAVLGGGTLGAVLLVVAEFTPLLKVHSSASRRVIETVSTGAHHSYALIPIALLAALLTWGVSRTGNRWALLATGVLGLVALLIALVGDLPDAQATGLVGSAATKFAAASSSPSTGLYLETLGAIVLLITAGVGLLMLPGPSEGALYTRSDRSPPADRSGS